jgi:Fe-S cluster assembly protein SufB
MCPPGVRCPMELSTYFRINEKNTGQFERTLIIAEEGLRLLSGRLHRAAARRKPAACRRGRADRAGRCRDQVFDGAELVSGRQGRQGRHLQFRHQARRLPRQPVQDLLDAGRDRFGDHLEIPVLHPARRQFRGEFYSIAVSNGYQQIDSGTKMIHLGKNTSSRIISKGISAGKSNNTYRGLVRRTARRRTPATSPSATRC